MHRDALPLQEREPKRFDAVILAGGRARRLGGVDKPMEQVGRHPMLHLVLHAVEGAMQRVVVGPPRALAGSWLWVQESPPGAGPVAAVAAGIPLTSADVVVVLAADLPWVAPAVIPLVEALGGEGPADAALLATDGQANYLAAAWKRPALVGALAKMGPTAGASLRRLYEQVAVIRIEDRAGWGRDCDTWDDLGNARREMRCHPR